MFVGYVFLWNESSYSCKKNGDFLKCNALYFRREFLCGDVVFQLVEQETADQRSWLRAWVVAGFISPSNVPGRLQDVLRLLSNWVTILSVGKSATRAWWWPHRLLLVPRSRKHVSYDSVRRLGYHIFTISPQNSWKKYKQRIIFCELYWSECSYDRYQQL